MDSTHVLPQGSTRVVAELRRISKRFGPTRALQDVSLTINSHEVHALLGENGAGKTTLMNILTGLYRPDTGSVIVAGSTRPIQSPADASRRGIGMVHQHFELISAFTAFENIILGAERAKLRIDERSHRRRIGALAERYGLQVRLGATVGDMEIGDQQKVEILRVLYGGARLLILDEPTTHLTPHEVDQLFSSVTELAAEGVAVVLIAHKVREILALADTITVLRKGAIVDTMRAADTSAEVLVSQIMGETTSTNQTNQQEVFTAQPKQGIASTRTVDRDSNVLNLHCVKASGGQSGIDLHEVRISVDAGEVVGIAGVAGNGQRELSEILAGVRDLHRGSMILNGGDVTRCSALQRIREGVAVIPGDRIRDGILPGLPTYETFALGQHCLRPRGTWTIAHEKRSAKIAIDSYQVATPNEMHPVANLSGGNIQKLLVARAINVLQKNPHGLLVAMNPTSGLDVSATAFVRDRIRDAARAGHGVLLISEDLDELLSESDRIIVLEGGHTRAEFVRRSFNRTEIGRFMTASDLAQTGSEQ